MNRIITVILTFTLLMSVWLIPSSNMVAFEEATDTNVNLAVLSDELQELENEANEKYNELLNEWSENSQFVTESNVNYPDFYGGAYINNEKELVIQVTYLDDSIEEYFGSIINLTNVVFEEVSYSFNELKQAHGEIVEKMNPNSSDLLISSIAGVGISFPDNSVSLYVVTSDAVAKTSAFNNQVRDNISDFENIKIISTPGKDATVADLEPGAEITDSGYTRSAGFWARNANGDLGIITAPHSSISQGDTIWVGTTVFGTASTPYFSGSVDAVFVERTNANFSATRYISGWNFNLISGTYTTLAVGSTTYSKGKATGCKSGVIVDTNYTTSYNISDCVVTSATCDSGDSGGIVAGGGSSSSRRVAGIMTGKQGGTNYIIYVKAANIISTLGITVY